MRAAGTASQIALAAAASDRSVQLIGRICDDPTADAVLIDLARGGVGHVALLRDVSHPTPLEPSLASPADLDDASEAIPPSLVRGLPMDADDVGLGPSVSHRLRGRRVRGWPGRGSSLRRRRRRALGRGAAGRRRGAGRSRPRTCPPMPSSSRRPRPTRTGASRQLVGAFAAALDAGDRARRRVPRPRSKRPAGPPPPRTDWPLGRRTRPLGADGARPPPSHPGSEPAARSAPGRRGGRR